MRILLLLVLIISCNPIKENKETAIGVCTSKDLVFETTILINGNYCGILKDSNSNSDLYFLKNSEQYCNVECRTEICTSSIENLKIIEGTIIFYNITPLLNRDNNEQ